MATEDPQQAKFQQARSLYQLGDREQALALLYSIVTVAPGHLDAWWVIAQIAPQLQQRQQAAERVLELDPSHQEARALLERIAQLNVSTPALSRPPDSFPTSPTPPPGQPGDAPPATYQQITPPAYTPPPIPTPAPEPPPQREREIVHIERERRVLQPFLVVNGGCTSGCFSLMLTVLAVAALTFLLVGDTVQQALREAGALRPNEGATASMIAAMTITLLTTFAQRLLNTLPINLSGLIPAQGALTGGAETPFTGFIHNVWSLFGYPSNVGDTILARLNSLGPQLSESAWIVLAIFLGFWVILAFIFVFLRARSSRLLHWFLSTVGLWVTAALALGIGVLLFRVVSGSR